MRLRFAVLAFTFLASTSCEAPIDPPVERAAAPIVNGQDDSGHTYAVALTLQGQAFCSGTVVSPTVIVTAAHCIFPGIGIDPPQQIQVYFGSNVFGGGEFIDVVDGVYFPTFDVNSPAADNDVAVLRLAKPSPVAPIRMGKAPQNHQTVTLVGFGITSSGGSGAGIKRVTSAVVDLLAGKTFQMQLDPGGTCNGDSGGTAIYTEPDGMDAFVGIHTRSDCQNYMLDERVDKHIDDFIQPFIDADATCVQDFGCAKGCAAPDPDCPCADDGFCTAACTTPADDPDCASDPCAADGTCNAACTATDPDCPVCDADGTCNAACADDPDCGTGGAGGGGATTGSGAADDGPPTTTTECACRAGGASAPEPLVAFPALAALGALAWRRRPRPRGGSTIVPSRR